MLHCILYYIVMWTYREATLCGCRATRTCINPTFCYLPAVQPLQLPATMQKLKMATNKCIDIVHNANT